MAISATRSLREEQVVTNFARNFSIHDRDACDRNKFRSLSVQPTVKSSQQKSTMNRCIFCVIKGLMIRIKPLGCSRPMLQQNSFHDLVHAHRENIHKAGGTIEEQILELHQSKWNLADSLLDGNSELSAEELLVMLRS